MISVLVVDDSAFMRRAIAKILESEKDIRVIGTARNGEEGVAKTLALRPDIVTMDFEMPEVDGLEAVRRIVAHAHIPIIMVSAHTREGAETTFRALELGAVDFVAKPDAAYTNIDDVARDLIEKVRGSTHAHVAPKKPQLRSVSAPDDIGRSSSPNRPAYRCVAIGASTGGPVALAQILPALPADFPVPVLVVQHMPAGFTAPLAERLDALSSIRVREGRDGMELEPRTVTVAPAGKQLLLRRAGDGVMLHLIDDADSQHVPSVDALCAGVASTYRGPSVGVILTGMGRDGVEGLRKLKARGGYIVAQDEVTSVVYGMPRAAALAGVVDRVAPLAEIPGIIFGLLGTGSFLPQA
jgi:two-component system chemotaxis response regulator CheB